MTSKLWGLGAALACGAQILLLAGHGVGALLVSATLAWAVWQIWWYRGWLGTHVDMIILMCGYGGLGMMAGARQCHNTAQAWFEMTAGMLIFGLVPVFFGSRCFAAARRAGDAIALLFFDTLGMAAGMAAMHVEMSFVSASPLVKHLATVFGMAAGMIAGAAGKSLYSRRSRRKDSNIRYANDTRSLSA